MCIYGAYTRGKTPVCGAVTLSLRW